MSSLVRLVRSNVKLHLNVVYMYKMCNVVKRFNSWLFIFISSPVQRTQLGRVKHSLIKRQTRKLLGQHDSFGGYLHHAINNY